jgi:lipoprotein-releasing system permease protein
MYLPIKIAKRYFFSKKKTSFISLISWLAMGGVAFGTAALVIVLSVFNGLEDLNRSLFKSFDADFTIEASKAKRFELSANKISNLKKIEEIQYITEVLQENALTKYGNSQTVATIKGVDSTFLQNDSFKKSIIDGQFNFGKNGQYNAIVGIGIQQSLQISLENFYTSLSLWFPKNDANLAAPSMESFSRVDILPGSIFSIEQAYDNFVFIPIAFARKLFNQPTAISALEITLKKDQDIEDTRNKISNILGQSFSIKTRDEKHQGLLKAIKFEKLFVFITLLFIIGISEMNIFFSLSMLVIEKKDDIKSMVALGANASFIKNIFKVEGAIIAIIGAITGLVIGLSLCLIQLKYGLLKMGMTSALVDEYPIRIEMGDLIYTAIALTLITILIAYIPAKRAAKFGLNF